MYTHESDKHEALTAHPSSLQEFEGTGVDRHGIAALGSDPTEEEEEDTWVPPVETTPPPTAAAKGGKAGGKGGKGKGK